ncbi:hypothetical protein LTR62_008000 [Meristemomyces frigidus]|uniref:Uncharacterized protein n=1 Tax=Meristemomyces frigidus TaxID=1508187 RepID=A0AAN7TUV3_9PEZI|nr:hypothetical protein LTR62_008000 [Meristemomyces frigidus]
MAPRKPLGWRKLQDSGFTAPPVDTVKPSATEAKMAQPATTTNGIEPEYHTDDDEEDDVDGGILLEEIDAKLPYLPAHLLKPEQKPIPTSEEVKDIPFEQMTRQQKLGSRRSSRQKKKRQYDRLQAGTTGSGVIEAGNAAQAKRGILAKSANKKTGRVSKKGKVIKPQVSGRQQMLEARQQQVSGANAGPIGRRKVASKG